MNLNKDVHLRQLRDLLSNIPDLSSGSAEFTVGHLLLDPNYNLFVQVYAAILMHAFYRPTDPSRTVWLLMPRRWDQSYWQPSLESNQPHPTHVLGLLKVSMEIDRDQGEEELTILIWGSCELAEDNTLSVQLIYCDNRGRISSSGLEAEVQNTVWEAVEAGIPFAYQIGERRCSQAEWTESLSALPPLELDMFFCQIISAVVHDMPLNAQALSEDPPATPQWNFALVQAQIQLLLGQRFQNALSFEMLSSETGFVPECIYLHG
jgi:hypothetical protein